MFADDVEILLKILLPKQHTIGRAHVEHRVNPSGLSFHQPQEILDHSDC